MGSNIGNARKKTAEGRWSRCRAITSRECKLQTTLSQVQQSELEFHDSKPITDEFEVLEILSKEDLKSRRDCF